MKKVMKDSFLKLMFNILKNNMTFTMIYKIEYVIHKGNLKTTLNHELVFKKLHRIIKFKQKAW